jgi:hypothetical protein
MHPSSSAFYWDPKAQRFELSGSDGMKRVGI